MSINLKTALISSIFMRQYLEMKFLGPEKNAGKDINLIDGRTMMKKTGQELHFIHNIHDYVRTIHLMLYTSELYNQ